MALADLITELRILVNDTPTSNTIVRETPVGVLDGSNTHFRLQNTNVVPGSVYVTMGSTFRTQAGFTTDTANALLAFTSAPAANTKPWEVDYNFQWFTDTDHTQFLCEGSGVLGYSSTDPTTVPAALYHAMMKFACAAFWRRRSSQYAHKYASSGGQVGHSVDVVTKAFNQLAKDAFAEGEKLRDAYWNKQGRKLSPASGTTTYNIDPGSPIR